MELKINSIDGISNLSFAFYRAAYFLTLNKRLPWSKVANGELVAKVTNEFNVYLRYYDNKKNSDVIDFTCEYSYSDKDHQRQRYKFSERFREKHNGLYEILSCKNLFDTALEFANHGKNGNAIDSYGLILEFQYLKELKEHPEFQSGSPFNYNLLYLFYNLAILG